MNDSEFERAHEIDCLTSNEALETIAVAACGIEALDVADLELLYTRPWDSAKSSSMPVLLSPQEVAWVMLQLRAAGTIPVPETGSLHGWSPFAQLRFGRRRLEEPRWKAWDQWRSEQLGIFHEAQSAWATISARPVVVEEYPAPSMGGGYLHGEGIGREIVNPPWRWRLAALLFVLVAVVVVVLLLR